MSHDLLVIHRRTVSQRVLRGWLHYKRNLGAWMVNKIIGFQKFGILSPQAPTVSQSLKSNYYYTTVHLELAGFWWFLMISSLFLLLCYAEVLSTKPPVDSIRLALSKLWSICTTAASSIATCIFTHSLWHVSLCIYGTQSTLLPLYLCFSLGNLKISYWTAQAILNW